ncbi:MAG: alfa-L-rhamnosidase, partial [Clostridia bacterium]|nr:alfa-L-rhamnosidase [Clostridia bacterium]
GMPKIYPKGDCKERLDKDIYKRTVKAVTQTSLTLLLQFDLCLPSERQKIAKKLAELIRENGNRLTTGFVGTPYLLHALSENGYVDVAYDLLLQEINPSWLYAVNHGATTIWEHWDGVKEDGSFWSADMNSFNHYAYGAVYDWIFGVAAGIKVREDGAGYKRIRISPNPEKRIGFMDVTYETRMGALRSAWKYTGDRVTYTFTVPKGVEAEIYLPNEGLVARGSGEFSFERQV